MNIDDFESRSSYIILYRSQFKCGSDFEDLCDFLKVDKSHNILKVLVDECRISDCNMIRNFSQSCKNS